MKTKTIHALQYSSYPLKLIESDAAKEIKPHLIVARIEAFRNTYHFHATNTMINDPINWDESWFGSYE